MGALCLINKLYIMNYYKPIKYYTERGMIDLSTDQIKKRIKKIQNHHKDHETIIKKLKVGRTYAWAINYHFLDLFERERKLRANVRKLIPKHQIKHSKINKRMDYQFEISINLKGGMSHDNVSYDQSYYNYIIEQIFIITRQDLLFVHEQDKYGYNHIHIASNGTEDDIKLAIDFVMVHKLGFNRKFLNTSRAIHCERLENQHAFRQYLKKLQYYPSFGKLATNQENYIYLNENYEEQ